jgi:2-keto-3-deoxy-L-rhamnonate aldolase RhmA
LTSLRARARAGETLLGCFLTWPVAGVVELAALAGFDFVLIDVEHGFFSIESVASTILACDGAGIAPLVRPPSALSDQVGRYLDAGAAGTLLPRVESVAMARSAVEALKFAPLGRRGLGGVRANRYATEPLAGFVTRANEETLVAVQIEREGALAELSGLAEEPAVDVLFVGPSDLSQALGSPGDTSSERFQSALAGVASEATRAGKTAGIMVGNREQIPALRDLGYRLFTTSDRALVLESAKRWREALPVPLR